MLMENEELKGAVLLEPEELDEAIIGTAENRFVYSMELLIPLLPGETEEEKWDWYGFNTERSLHYMGDRRPIIVEPFWE